MGNADRAVITRRASSIPIEGSYDAIICGGGPAGSAAALAAARLGLRTLLVEALSTCGGMATAAFVSYWCDSPGGPIWEDFLNRLDALGVLEPRHDPVRFQPPGRFGFHGETMKALTMQMLREAGVHVLVQTTATGAIAEGDVVSGVTIHNKSGPQACLAPVVIDCTADADIAASAGAECASGDPADGHMQNLSYTFKLQGANPEELQQAGISTEQLQRWVEQARAEGRLHVPRDLMWPAAERFPFTGDYRLVTTWEVGRIDVSDGAALSACMTECQVIALEVAEFARRYLPGYEEARIGRLPELIGARESRRLVGQYILTGDDVIAGRKFEDGVVEAHFYTDLHDPPPHGVPHTLEHVLSHRPPQGQTYDIPYRCLVPVRVRGLLVAGRCLSADRLGHGSARIMPTCMYLGTAAGAAAALCTREGVLPHELRGQQVKQLLNTLYRTT